MRFFYMLLTEVVLKLAHDCPAKRESLKIKQNRLFMLHFNGMNIEESVLNRINLSRLASKTQSVLTK